MIKRGIFQMKFKFIIYLIFLILIFFFSFSIVNALSCELPNVMQYTDEPIISCDKCYEDNSLLTQGIVYYTCQCADDGIWITYRAFNSESLDNLFNNFQS